MKPLSISLFFVPILTAENNHFENKTFQTCEEKGLIVSAFDSSYL